MQKVKFVLPVAALKALDSFTGKKDPRTYLAGIKVEVRTGHAVLVATDGKCLAAYRVDLPDHEGYMDTIMAPLTIERTLGIFKKGDVEVEVSKGEQYTHVEVMGTGLGPASMDSIYPQWRPIMGRMDNLELAPATYQGPYLERYSKASKLISGDKMNPVTVYSAGDLGGLVKLGNCENFIGVIMPLAGRAYPADRSVPEWVK